MGARLYQFKSVEIKASFVLALVQTIRSCFLTSPGPNPVDGIAFYANFWPDKKNCALNDKMTNEKTRHA